MTNDLRQRMAEAMEAKRQELIAKPMARIWPELADAAIAAMPGWQSMESAPKDRPVWGKVKENAVRMFWHEDFGAFISSFHRMTMAPGYTINGKSFEDHSPEIVNAEAWMDMPLPLPPHPEGE